MTDETNVPDLDVDIPAPGGLSVTTERPYHILVVTNYAGADGGSLSGELADGVVPLTADRFDDVMAAALPTTNFTTADPLTTGGTMVEMNLGFASLRDFDPANLASQIRATRALRDVRDRLTARLKGSLTADQLAADVAKLAEADATLAWLPDAIRPKATPAAPAPAGAVDDVLGQLDLGDRAAPSAPPSKSPVGKVIAAAATGGATIPAGEVAALRGALAEIDRRIGVWLTHVLHAPPVQLIESAWRSLAHLVSQTDFRKGVRLSILHAPRATLLERFRTLLIDPVFDAGADAPDLVVIDTAFGNTAADLEALDELAQHGASLPALVFAGAAPSFFGVKNAWQIATLPALVNVFDQWQFAKWKSLRGQPYARSLCVFFGRGLLRAPHERAATSNGEFAYHEECIGDHDLVWSNGSMAAACAVSRSVADTGWPVAMAGFLHGRVAGFSVATAGKKNDTSFGPTDTKLPQAKLEEMAAVGVNAVAGIREQADAFIWNGLTAAQPGRFDSDSLLQVSAPYQLFAGRLSNLLLALKPRLMGLSRDQLLADTHQHIQDWLTLPGQPPPTEINVMAQPVEGQPTATDVAITVTPPAHILPGGIPIVLGIRLV